MDKWVDSAQKALSNFWQWALTHPELAVDLRNILFGVIGVILAGLVRLAPKIWRRLKRRRSLPTAVDSLPFEVIEPYSDNILQRLLGSNYDKATDPLADFNIPYQNRQANRSVQVELEQALDQKGWVLILGRSGLGKSREAAEFTKRLNERGWTILKLKAWEWLGKPDQFPMEKIGTDRQLLFFLDDLNRPCYSTRQQQQDSRQAGMQQLITPLQDRLLEMLEKYEVDCRREQIRVIATARNEKVALNDAEPSEWEKLELDRFPKFRDRFAPYELPALEPTAGVDLLAETARNANVQTEASDYEQMARSNDGTFRNLVLNLRDAQKDNVVLNFQRFRPTLQGSWEQHYQRAKKQYPATPYIYDAVWLLRSAGVALYDFTVAPTALMIASRRRHRLKRPLNRWQIRRALRYLIEAEHILTPSDGQIEAKEPRENLSEHIPRLSQLLLKLTDRHSSLMLDSLFNFAITTSNLNYHSETFISFKKLLQFIPEFPIAWFSMGYALFSLGQNKEAIDAYNQAIYYKPDLYEAWNNKGIAPRNSGQNKEAIDAYNQAIHYKQDDHEAWYNKGIALFDLGQYKEAIDAFTHAIHYKQGYHEAWYNKGNALFNLGQYKEAIGAFTYAIHYKQGYHEAWYNQGTALAKLGDYQKAIDAFNQAIHYKQDDHEAWNNKGNVLHELKQYDKAIDSYEQALKHKPDLYEAWYNRGNVLAELERYNDAIDSYEQALKHKPGLYEAWYNKARCYGLQGKVEEAIKNLQQAIELDPKYREMAKTDADFDLIRGDDRFQALIEGSN